MTQTEASKRARMRLAKAELIAQLAMTTECWRSNLLHEKPDVLPPEDWAPDDPFVVLARTYDLPFADLAKLCNLLGDDLEARAIRAGYDEHWDAAPTGGA